VSDTITTELIGDRELVARFGELAPKVHLRLVKAMQRLTFRLQSLVKGAKLSGQVLHVRTGHLRASIGAQVSDTTDTVTGTVGIPTGPTLGYGRAHEFGFEDVVTVREHLRQVKQAFGRPIAAVSATVRSHQRTLHLPERSFLRSAFRENRDAVVAVLQGELQEAVRAG
jgi:hypothetical protein